MAIDRTDAVVLRWTYEPENFFEEPICVSRDDCEIDMADGAVTAFVVPSAYDQEHEKRDELHEVVEGFFHAVQVMRHKGYTLSKAAMSREYPDGRRDVTVFAVAVQCRFIVNPIDFRVTDADGNVVTDTRRERLDRERAFQDALSRLLPTDPLLRKLLASYQASVADPGDELVHLFEVREALQKHFGGERKARGALGLSDSQWKPLGRLACDEPIKTGRHRGAHLAELRDATKEELEEARGIAKGLIDAYVRWADATRPYDHG